jgi:ribonuclease E
VKRAIRDLYHRDIDEVLVEGEDGYKAARGFMKLLMPSHVKKVQPHSEATPCSSATASRTSWRPCTSRSSS